MRSTRRPTPAAPARRKRRSLRREKPRRGTVPMIIALGALLVLLVLFAPMVASTPAANVSGTQVDPETAATGDVNLRVSEVMASNRTAFPDETGAFPDWIELTNAGTEPISLKGYGMSDRPDRITFVFPDITLAPGELLIVFASDDNRNDAGAPLHAQFKLSSGGTDTLYLFGSDGVAFREFPVPAMDRDMSYAWIGNEDYIITEQYSPGYPNTQEGYAQFRSETLLETGALVINEVCASSITTLRDEDGEYPDWVELHNASNQPIDLSNYALSDDTGKLVKWRFPQGCVIEPGGYFVVFCSGKDRAATEGSWPHASFRLRSNGETVILSDVQGRLVDMTAYDLLEADTSWGRYEEGDGSFRVFANPTPGLPNTRAGEVAMDTALCLANTSGLYITEVMTGNKSIHGPGVKYFYDYIELYNMSGQAVNLAGYGLSDNIKKPRKWQLPDITLENNAYAVIYCDTTQTSSPGEYYFTNYNLKKSGETVCLSTPEGVVLDRIAVPQLYDDVSYGRTLGQAGLFYYSTPTPGAENAQGFTGFAEQPEFLTVGGLYERPLTGDNAVAISVPAGSTVRYTTDGTDPTEASALYTQPLEINQTTCLRARAFREGVEPSQVVSQTYFVSVYHTMPVVCLTTDPYNLNNEETGMFADGPTPIDRENTDPPWKTATYWQKNWFGGWVEYYDEEGVQQLSQGMSFRVMGQYSLDMPQKSLYVKADGQYGKDSFDYALFEDRPFDSYKSFVLRNGGQDGLYTRVIDGLQARIIDESGSTVLNQAWKPVIVYINGEYWGHYNLRERAGVDMVAQHEGWTDADAIDMLESDGLSTSQVNNGSRSDYMALYNYAKEHDPATDPEAYEYICSQFDIDNMIDYFIFEAYFGNTDPGNIRFYRNTKEGDGKWRYLFYDSDWGFFNVLAGKSLSGGLAFMLNEKGMGHAHIVSNIFIRKLIKVPEFQDRFLRRYGELFQTVFTTEHLTELFNSMIRQIQPEMQMHMQRWAALVPQRVSFDQPKNPEGGYNYWVSRCERTLERIFPRRPYYMWHEAQDYFGLTDEQMIGYFGPCPPTPEE